MVGSGGPLRIGGGLAAIEGAWSRRVRTRAGASCFLCVVMASMGRPVACQCAKLTGESCPCRKESAEEGELEA
jgi:hypothetical protein